MLDKVNETYPNIKVVGNTLREVRSASFNNWSACLGEGDHTSNNIKIWNFDRRGGDSFASGDLWLMEKDHGLAVEYGAAHGALAMTTAGMRHSSSEGGESLMSGGSARVALDAETISKLRMGDNR